MFRFRAIFFAALSFFLVSEAFSQERAPVVYSGPPKVFLEIMRSPPNRHVIAMASMADCREAAQFTNAKCVYRQPKLPDTSAGTMRSTNWSPRAFFIERPSQLTGRDFGPVYLVVREGPPNRHVIAMNSMKTCLEAAAYTSAECVRELPKLPDTSIGVLRTFE